MYKLNFTLKQHTPLIHFQHDQDGATLRATEVKPKLDRFIIEKLGNGDFEQGKKTAKDNGWLVGNGEKPALDYKMRVEAEKPIVGIDGEIVKDFPCFFADMGTVANSNPKKFAMHENVSIKIHSWNLSLLKDEIANSICMFFMKHNFGTRQSKGFGSFYPEKNILLDGNPLKDVYKNHHQVPLDYLFSVNVNKNTLFENQKALFTDINIFYTALRAGNSLKKVSPMIYHYAVSKGLRWEKDEIKEKFFKIVNPDTITYPPYIIKDLLGLATESEWLSEKDTITKEEYSKEIERYKSPIHIKPIYSKSTNGYIVYFDASNEDLNMYDKRFVIKSKKVSPNLLLNTPNNHIFNMQDFFDFAFDESNIDNYLNNSNAKDIFNRINKYLTSKTNE